MPPLAALALVETKEVGGTIHVAYEIRVVDIAEHATKLSLS
jgi:hypothetical protein